MSDELIDVVNDEDIVISQAMRSAAHRDGLLHRGVHVFLIAPDGRLLVQQRSASRKVFPMALDCSISEHVIAGESYLQAARRGLVEELGIKGASLRALVKFKYIYGPNDIEISQLYEGFLPPAEVHPDPIEVEKIAYYNLVELENLYFSKEVEFSGWFVQLLRWYLGKSNDLVSLKSYPSSRLLLKLNPG